MVLLGFTEFHWIFNSFFSVLPSFYWVLLGFTGFHWVLLGFTQYHWVFQCFSLGFTWFSAILLVFTGFDEFFFTWMYWVSAGFTGFYWIFIGSNQVKLGFPGFDRTVQGFLFKSWSDFSLTSVHPLKKKKISAVGRRELGEKKEKKKRRKEKEKMKKKKKGITSRATSHLPSVLSLLLNSHVLPRFTWFYWFFS